MWRKHPALVATRTWDTTRDVLLAIGNKAGGTVRSSYTCTVNDIGQRTAVATGGSEFTGSPADWSWRYDALGQLEKAALGTTGDKGRNYQYDAIGNRVTSAAGNWNANLTAFTPSSTASYYGVLFNGTPSAPGANPLNQYAAIRGQFTADPVHDYDGNMTSGPVPGSNGNTPGVQAPANATNIVWDAENRLVSATVAGVIHTYAYDHLSRLVSRSVGVPPTSSTYIYDGWNRIAEYDGAGVLQDTFTWGLDLSGTMQGAGGVGGLLATRWASASGSPTYYPTYDGNGNISEYLTAAGLPAVHYEYDPFGALTRLTGGNSTRFQYRFSTKPRDPDTGLYYYGHRWYDPLTGRWPSRDPIEERGGVNLYGFVENNSVHRFDAFGLSGSCRCCVIEPLRVERGGDTVLPSIQFHLTAGLGGPLSGYDCDPKCCEVRQMVRGSAIYKYIRDNGEPVVLNKAPQSGRYWDKSMVDNEWTEEPYNREVKAGDYYDMPDGSQRVRHHDIPGSQLPVASGHHFELTMDFVAYIADTCQKESLGPPNFYGFRVSDNEVHGVYGLDDETEVRGEDYTSQGTPLGSNLDPSQTAEMLEVRERNRQEDNRSRRPIRLPSRPIAPRRP
ncbi:MAG: RHS repeat-associated core domain-containing protein [Verrucomicrobia bacterium]|nr:RHS repeat-associated core domain-containing protein [Verrucomicrobiota bacterium]